MKKVAEQEGGKLAAVKQWVKQVRHLYALGKEVAASAAAESEWERQYQALINAVVKLARPCPAQGPPSAGHGMLLMRHRDEGNGDLDNITTAAMLVH